MKQIKQTIVKTRHALSMVLMTAIMLASYALTAQVAVTTDGSSADGSAMLEVKSTDKGFLPPRMTETEIGNIASPANGLLVFNTTDNKVYVFVSTDNDDRLIRIMRRDIVERGRSYNDVLKHYETYVKPMHEQFIEPSKLFADVIIPLGGENQVAIDMLVSRIKINLHI